MFSRLALQRPIVFFDLETTGKNIATDRIVELCAIKVFPNRTRAVYHQRYNPGVPIHPDATAKHGITDAMVANEPPFASALNTVVALFDGCDVAGFNVLGFDIPLLSEELLRNGATYNPLDSAKVVDCMSIYHRRETRTLTDAVKFYTQQPHDAAHQALADVEATINVFSAQLDQYMDLEADVQALHTFSTNGQTKLDYAGEFAYDVAGDLIFTRGKNKGNKVSTNLDMCRWMLSERAPKDRYTRNTLQCARNILDGKVSLTLPQSVFDLSKPDPQPAANRVGHSAI